MCGITGFAERNHKAETARRIVKGMADLITYRGPDGEGYYVDDQVALGHRRLSIIDLEGGKQPMFNEDGSLVCIFNGEIYNFQTLREELIAAGHTFACLLYTSDAADELDGVDLGGRRIIKKNFFKQKTAYEICACLVGSEMCIRDRQSCLHF